ncbi:MAG: thiamine diphosphokinase [Spirochaetales bacterium]|nr:thiamine diphosphokinase [Candidatus Physcosoma equi]
MNRCVVFAGGPIEDYGRIQSYLKKGDFLVAADCGLRHLSALGLEADLVVGDFDSHPFPKKAKEKIVLPREKDETDTLYALKAALRRGYKEFLILGATGKRLDHTLGNVYALEYLEKAGAHGTIVDDWSEMELCGKKPLEIPDTYLYFSLIALSGKAEGITIRGAKYPLENGTIEPSFQYGISNEVLPGETAVVTVEKGSLLVIRITRE